MCCMMVLGLTLLRLSYLWSGYVVIWTTCCLHLGKIVVDGFGPDIFYVLNTTADIIVGSIESMLNAMVKVLNTQHQLSLSIYVMFHFPKTLMVNFFFTQNTLLLHAERAGLCDGRGKGYGVWRYILIVKHRCRHSKLQLCAEWACCCTGWVEGYRLRC